MGRLVSAFVGLGAVLLSLYGALWVMLSAVIAAQRPDPLISDGDPCCVHPDTWGEVVDWSFWALTMASMDALLLAGAVACLGYAGSGHRPRWRRRRWIPIGTVAITAALMALALVAPT
ncbi:hypothetical protein [Solirubrobacter soli]|uniref:hypothetical protein n=1 Tax=Solirubrobacter soli TaxID=363832 RepID=UPI000420D085|nr:hypothetical protein [Solirubrobacter soli]